MVGMMGARELDRLDPVGGLQGRVAVRLQEVVEQLHVQLVVLDDQHRLLHDPLSRCAPIMISGR
jgi:hypothetical protein